MSPSLGDGLARVAADYLWGRSSTLGLVLDGDGRVVEANAAARRLLGDSVVGRGWSEIFLDFDGSLAQRGFVPGERLLSVVVPGQDPASFRFHSVIAPPHSVLFGEPDIAGEMRWAQVAREVTQDLSVLTRELHQRNRELSELNAAKNELLGMAAHDLRNPLTIIIGYTEALIDELGPVTRPSILDLLFRVEASARRMQELLDGLLDISAVEAGSLKLNRSCCDLRELVAEEARLHQPLASRYQVVLRSRSTPKRYLVEVDPSRIRQVVDNLLGNALKYTPAGGTVEVGVRDAEGEAVVFVADTGPGLSAQDQARLFRPFSRADVAPVHGRSTGLGLAIARKLVSAHGGRIWVESAPAVGSTFAFSLPLALGEGAMPNTDLRS
jgi:signal transduction histidine kinase